MKLLQFICVIIPLKFFTIVSPALILFGSVAMAHGPGHQHSAQTATPVFIANDFAFSGNPHTDEHRHEDTKSKVIVEELDKRIWGVSFMSGWESRHVHYGVNESDSNSVLFGEAAARIYDIYLSAWAGFALGNEFQEWDFTASYRLELGPVFFLPGYNFRTHPNAHAHIHNHPDHHDHSEHMMPDGTLMSDDEMISNDETNGAHIHSKYNHELFIVVGTTIIPYVTPSANFLWDLYEQGGGFLEFRLDGNLPIYKDTFALRPYTLLGVNLGYNTWHSLGLNNYQLGIQGIVNLTRNISLFAGVSYSVALPALRAIDQGRVVWADTGLLVSF